MIQTSPIQWGIAGTGRIADWIVQDMQRLPEIMRPTAVFSRSRQKATDFAARHGTPVVAETFTRLAITQLLKTQLLEVLEYGLNLEVLAAISA